jgi:hypothetical protein
MNPMVRLQHTAGAADGDLLIPDFLPFFVHLHDHFAPRAAGTRRARGQSIPGALCPGRPPGSPREEGGERARSGAL